MGEKKIRVVTIRIEDSTYQMLCDLAKDKEWSVSHLVRHFVLTSICSVLSIGEDSNAG